MVHIGTPRSSLHQILNYRLFPICRFTDEVGTMQRLLKPTLQLHLQRSPLGSPKLPEAIAHYMALILLHIPFTRSRPLVPQCLALATSVALLDIGFLT
jgi:hypothetical protein